MTPNFQPYRVPEIPPAGPMAAGPPPPTDFRPDIFVAMEELAKAIACGLENAAVLRSRLNPVTFFEPDGAAESRIIDSLCPLSGDIRQRAADVWTINAILADIHGRLQLP